MSDEFNFSTLNNKWEYLPLDYDANYPLLKYESNNVTIDENDNNYLKINFSFSSNNNYSTGGIRSKLFNYQYGYYEWKARVPYGKGFMPTLWLWGAGGLYGIDSYTEIDVLEPSFCQNFNGNTNVVGAHSKVYPPCSSTSSSPFHKTDCDKKIVEFWKTNITDMQSNWHKYAVEWLPDRIIFYLDDEPFAFVYANDPVYTNITFPSDQCRLVMYTRLQVDPTSDCNIDGSSNLNQEMQVDWFRFHQLQMDCNEIVDESNLDFNTYSYSVKKTIKLTKSTVPSSSHTTLRATDYIILGSEFMVPANTELNLIPTKCF